MWTAKKFLLGSWCRKRSEERIAKGTDRDFYLNAEEAKEYGVVDDILKKNEIEKSEE